MKYSDCGLVHLKATKRPFLSYRQIKKGKDKGKVEIVLLGDKIKVLRGDIERYPKGE